MAAYFADTSGLAKRYIAETGTTWLRSLLGGGRLRVSIGRTTAVEIVAAIRRRELGGTMSATDSAIARAAFRHDLAHEYAVVELSPDIAFRAMSLAETHALRGYDAIQLSSALEVNGRYVAAGRPPIIFISSDAELNTAAMAEGLIVDDPNAHP